MSTQTAYTTAQTGFGYVNLVQTNLQIIINETYTPSYTTAQTGFGYVNLVQTNLQIIINETYTPSLLNCNNYDFG